MKQVLFVLFSAALALCANEIDIGKPRAGTQGVETIQIDGKNAVRISSTAAMPDTLRLQRNFGLKLKPNTNYVISYEMRTNNITPRPTKGMKGAGINLVSGGKLIYRGSHLGRWRHTTGTIPWTKFEYKFKTGNDGMSYLYFELAEATGSAEFAKLSVSEAAPAPAPAVKAPRSIARDGAAPNQPSAALDFNNFNYSKGETGIVTVDGKAALQCTTSARNPNSYRRYSFKVVPKQSYKLTVYFRGKDLKPLAGKSLKGAGLGISSGNKTLYRGSDLGKWRHRLGTFDWTKIELMLTPVADTLYVTAEVADASGSAEFSDVTLVPAVPVKAKPAPRLSAKLFPVDFQKGVYYMARNFPQTLAFTLDGTTRPKAPVLELELPAGIECIAGSPLWPVDNKQKPWKYQSDIPVKTAITRQGKAYTRYSLAIGQGTVKNFKIWRNEYRVYIRSNGASGKAYWRLRDGNFTGEYKLIDLRDAGEISYPAKKLKNFHLTLHTQMNIYGGYPEVRDTYDRYWRALDEKPWLLVWHISWPSLPLELRKHFSENYTIGVGMSVLGSTPRFGFSSWLKRNNIPHNYRLRNPVSTKETSDFLCPEEVINDPGNIIWDRYAPEGIRGYCGGVEPKFVDFDFEPGAMGYCFCEVCRSKFSTPIMTKQEILAKHSKEWFEFRCKQHAEVARKFYKMVRKHFPGALPSMCTDPLHVGGSPLAQWCGVDPRLSDKDGVGIYMNMPYFEGVGYFDSMELNIRELSGAPHAPLVDPNENMERYYNRYTPNGVTTLMIAAAALGSVGQGFYPTDYFDGRYLIAIARGAGLIAQAEDFYLKGKRDDSKVKFTVLNSARYSFKDNGTDITVESPDFRPTIRRTVHEYNGKLLLTLFNYHANNAMIARIDPPAGFYGCELNSNRSLSAKRTVKIPAGSVALIEFTRNRPELPPLPDFENELANFKSSKPIGEYGLVNPEALVMPKVGNANSSAYIRMENNANVCSWKFASGADLCMHKDRGYLGDFIAFPNLLNRNVTFKITSPGVFEYQIPPPDDANPEPDPYEGLIIRKKYSVSPDGKELCAEFEVENASPRGFSMKLAPRLRNIPKVGAALAGNRPLAAITMINGSPSAALATPRPLNGKPVTVKVSDGARNAVMTIIPDSSFKQFFSWNDSNNLYTVEFFSEPFELKAGQKKKFNCRFRNGN